MKKITLFMCLMTLSLMHSQSLPFNFSSANQLLTGDGCTTSLTTDAGDAVLQIIGGGQLYDNGQIVFGSNLNLADDANNTITFRIKPVNGTGSGNHLLKFEDGVGGPATTELPFTTTGTSWQNITLNFGAGLGNYSKMVLFTDFNNASIDTYLVDDIAGGTNIAPPPPLATPSGPAPVPTLTAGQVVSMYGETYPNTYLYSFGQATDIDLDSSAGVNNALRINTAVAGFGAGYAETNVSTMQYVHFDYWTTNATTFSLYLISNSPVTERIYTISVNEPIVLNTWKSVDIPLSYFTNLGFNPVTWFQYKFDVPGGITPGIVFIDNIYFTTSTLGNSQFNSNKIKMYPNPTSSNLTIENSERIDFISIYNTLGQEIIRKSGTSNLENISVSDFQSGIYLVKIESMGTTYTERFIKK